jgi:3-oxoacyl-(acyl-carrier-protein) synthase
MFKRVVVTGMGMISPLGNKNETFINLINNKSVIIKLNEINNKSVKLRN